MSIGLLLTLLTKIVVVTQSNLIVLFGEINKNSMMNAKQFDTVSSSELIALRVLKLKNDININCTNKSIECTIFCFS